MSVITPEGTLVIENSHLDVRGNVNAVALKLGTARLTPSYDLAAVTGVGNTTPYTVEFSNATTGLATTSNLQVGGTLKLGGTVDFENPLSLAAVSLVSNTTPYTIEFSNAATGIATTANIDVGGELAVTGNATVSSNLTVSGNTTVSSNLTVGGNATVSSNLTVTGDLNVSGALGILDAIYPVGTVIDRATAITDTHLNGKYKAFLAAPDQEWELVSSPSVAIGDVSFLVHNTLSANYDIPAGDSIAWNGIKTNIGGGFQTTGTNINKFVTPVSGNYMFGVYISHRDTACELTLYVDGVATRDIMAGKDDNRDSTYNVLVPLSANNVVDLRARITTLTIYSISTEHSQNAWFGFKVGPGTPAITNYSYKRTV